MVFFLHVFTIKYGGFYHKFSHFHQSIDGCLQKNGIPGIPEFIIILWLSASHKWWFPKIGVPSVLILILDWDYEMKQPASLGVA